MSNPVPVATHRVLKESINKLLVIDVLKRDWDIDEGTTRALVDFINTGEVDVVYKESSKTPDFKGGRLYANTGLSIMRRDVRSYLLKNTHLDIDFENCHPNILYYLARDKGLPESELIYLGNYCRNVEKFRKEFPTLKDQIRQWMYDPNRNIEWVPDGFKPVFLEISKAVKYVVAGIDDDTTSEETKLSQLIQIKERIALDNLTNFLEEKDEKVVSLCMDGCIILKGRKDVQPLLDEWNKRFQYCKAVIKQWDEVELPPIILPDNRFDYFDGVKFNDILDLQQSFGSTISAFHCYRRHLLKTLRVKNWTEFCLKNSDRKPTIIRKTNFAYTYCVDGKCKSLIDVLKVSPQLFMVGNWKMFRANQCDFSLFPDFLVNTKNVRPDYETHIQPILKHILEVLCDNNTEMFTFFRHWLAAVVKHFPRKTESIMIFQGASRAGKSMIMEFIESRIFGELMMTLCGTDSITGSFNGHLSNKILIVLEEVRSDDDKRDFDKIKHIVTAKRLDSRKLYCDMVTDENGVNLLVNSNWGNPIKAVKGIDTRLVETEINPKYVGNSEYFSKLGNFLENDPDAPACFLKWLEDTEVDFNLLRHCKPMTESKQENMFNQLHPVEKILYIWKFGCPDRLEKFSSRDIYDAIRHYYGDCKIAEPMIGKKLTNLGISNTKSHGKMVRDASLFKFNPDILQSVKKHIMDYDKIIEDLGDCLLDDVYNLPEIDAELL